MHTAELERANPCPPAAALRCVQHAGLI
jgi:hypothetical protein